MLIECADRPGVLAQIATVFGEHQVSVGSVIQKGTKAQVAEVLFMTHEVIEGDLRVGEQGKPLAPRTLGILGAGSRVSVRTAGGARFLLVSAQPLNEPVARGGPFVMNTREEITQAFDDYRHNRF